MPGLSTPGVRHLLVVVATLAIPFTLGPRAASADVALGSYDWPVVGPVLRGFEPPPSPFAPGHRGIDIGAPIGTSIRAPTDGVVAFAGFVAGALFVSIDHPDGVRTSYSWLSAVSVARGDAVARGDEVALTGPGHPGAAAPHLHFSARLDGVYIDPMLLLGGGNLADVIHLAELDLPRAVAAPAAAGGEIDARRS